MAKVAIVDNGILETEIPDIVISKRNKYGKNNTLLRKYWYGMHGTICANIIKDISPDVEFYDVKVTDIDQPFSIWRLIEGLEWCEREGADIINLSLGTIYTEGIHELEACLKRLKKNGVFLVAACHQKGSRSYPAALDEVIKVSGETNGEYIVKIPACKVGDRWNVDIEKHNSFAAPVVTGHIANYLDKWGKGLDKDIRTYLCCQKGILFNNSRNQEIDIPVIRAKMMKSEVLHIASEFQNEGYEIAIVEKDEDLFTEWNNGRYDIMFIISDNNVIPSYPADIIIKVEQDRFRLEYGTKYKICETVTQIVKDVEREFGRSEM